LAILKIVDNDDFSNSNMPSHSGNIQLDHSHINLSGSEDTQPLYPMVQMATMVGSFLTLNSGPQLESLHLHPVPIDSVRTFVFPNGIDSADVPTHVTRANSSRTLLVETGGGFEEILVDMTVTARRNPVSSARGRNGPLSEESRAAMKLLKDIGACWHCRFTKGTVSGKSKF
jgi:hypothetical protein